MGDFILYNCASCQKSDKMLKFFHELVASRKECRPILNCVSIQGKCFGEKL